VAHTYGVSIFDVEGVPIVELSAGVASPLSALCWTSDWLVGAGICGTRVWHCSNRWMATDFDIETPSTLARIQPLSVGLLALDDGVVAYFTGQTIKVMCTAKLCPLALWESPNEMINGLYTNNTGGGGGGNSGGTSTKLCSLLADGSVAISAIAPAPQWTLAPVRHLLMSSNVSACALRPFDSLAALVMSDGSILFVPLD
jgi:hypothetical protein